MQGICRNGNVGVRVRGLGFRVGIIVYPYTVGILDISGLGGFHVRGWRLISIFNPIKLASIARACSTHTRHIVTIEPFSTRIP